MNEKVNLAQKLAQFSQYWSPHTVTQRNNYDLMVVKVRGKFIWHYYDETDDFCLGLSGQLVIRLRSAEVVLNPGELYVLPKGIEHQPYTAEETHILRIEPRRTPNTGNPGTAAPAGRSRGVVAGHGREKAIGFYRAWLMPKGA